MAIFAIVKNYAAGVLVQFENVSFTPPLQRGAYTSGWDWKPFKTVSDSVGYPDTG